MAVLILIYGLLVSLGGVVGYLKAKSLKSLYSGLACGLSLAISAYLAQDNLRVGLGLASFIATTLIVIFGMRFRKTQKFMPAGFLASLSFGMAIAFLSALLRLS